MGCLFGELHRAMDRATPNLEERKALEASRRRGAADSVMDALERYAKAHGGRFHVVGSAVTGQMRYDSDLGSGLIDQSQKMTAAAMQMAEKKVWAHRS